MIKQILVPTDGSEHAALGVQYGIGLAKQHEASLVGLHVVDIRLLEGRSEERRVGKECRL